MLSSAKEEKDEEEGTISRPSSPKEKEGEGSEKADSATQVSKDGGGLGREGSAKSVRIGEENMWLVVQLVCSVVVPNLSRFVIRVIIVK